MSLRDVCGSGYANKLRCSQAVSVAHGCTNVANTEVKGERLKDNRFAVLGLLSFFLCPLTFILLIIPWRIRIGSTGDQGNEGI